MANRDLIIEGAPSVGVSLGRRFRPGIGQKDGSRRLKHVHQNLISNATSSDNGGSSTTEVARDTIYGDTLTSNNDRIEARYYGFYANNANNKYVELRLNDAALGVSQRIIRTSTLDTPQNAAWKLTCEMIRRSVSILECFITYQVNLTSTVLSYTEVTTSTLASFTLASEYELVFNITGGATSDVTLHNRQVIYAPAPEV